MFTTLIESSPRSERRAAQGLVSLCFHVALGVGVLEASRRVVTPPDGPRVDTTGVFIAPPPAPQPRIPVVTAAAVEPGPALPDAPIVIDVPNQIPDGIPPVEPGPPIDPRRFVSATAVPGCGSCPGSGEPVAGSIFTQDVVDDPVQVLSQPEPGYPAILRSAGISGRVAIRFVVDSAGRVEPGSIDILEATHPAFGESAREAILRSKFRPARVKGVMVRQLVQQAVKFALQ